ncbi:MAG: STAS domain-containing protein [Actinomycetota bacterium]
MVEPFAVVQFGPNSFFLGGELDLATAPRLQDAVHRSVEAGGPILLDLSAVTFIDSSGLHAIVSMAKELGDRGCVLLHAPHRRVLRLIETVRLGDVKNIHVEACEFVAHPESSFEWTPPPDLPERFAELRQYIADDV